MCVCVCVRARACACVRGSYSTLPILDSLSLRIRSRAHLFGMLLLLENGEQTLVLFAPQLVYDQLIQLPPRACAATQRRGRVRRVRRREGVRVRDGA